LQSTNPDNEIVVYFPFQDILHTCNVDKDILLTINVHNPEVWFYNTEFQKTLSILKDNGFGYDYISDLQLINSNATESGLKTINNTYKTLIVPKCEYIPISTMEKLTALSKAGVPIIFLENLPEKYSGYSPAQESAVLLEGIKQQIQGSSVANLKIINLDKLSGQLAAWKNKQEELALHKLDFIRKKDDSGCIYFISNLNSGKDINSYIPIATNSKEYIFYNPLTGKKGKAEVKKAGNENSVLLQLKQGQSLFLFANSTKSNLTEWEYTGQEKNKIRLSGNR